MTTVAIKQKQKKPLDSWMVVSLVILAFYLLFMVYPLFQLLKQSLISVETGAFSFENFQTFFNTPSYVQAMGNSFAVSITVTVLALLFGIPLAYFMTSYKIKGEPFLRVLIILCSMSAPFIGAYSWIMLLGNNGLVTNLIKNITGIKIGSIYGFAGMTFVMATNLFTMVFLYVSGALKNIDNSLLEASANLGVSGFKRFIKVVIPLCMPTILAAALLVFMRAFADFGTPLMIGLNYKTFPVLIYDQYVGEVSTNKSFAAALSVIAILITTVFFLLQKWLNSKFTFTMNALHPIEQKKAKPLMSVLMHLYCYLLIAVSFAPQIYVIYSSFRNTRGKSFVSGYSLNSYKKALSRYKNAIPNTFIIGLTALALVILLSILVSYLVVRRRNTINSTIDIMTMIPYIIPGSVVGISLIIAFNSGLLVLTGTSMIMIIALIIRRSPYTIRSSVAILQQIPITIEEASISLGASKAKTFFKITLPMMMNGVVSGAILSWVSIITELSTAIYLYTNKSMTMTVAIYVFVSRGSDGYAAAMASILTLTTIISLTLYSYIAKKSNVNIMM